MSEVPVRARVDYSHLFPGVRLEITGARPDGLGSLVVEFSDGSTARAEVLVGEADGARVLAVDAYRTEAGTVLPDTTWSVKELVKDGDGVQLRLGVRLTPRH